MTNFNKLSDNILQLSTGVFSGVTSYDTYEKGELSGLKLSEKNMVLTHAGELVPAYTENHRRKNKYAVEFHRNGMIKAVYLEEQQEIETPIGTLPAELVTFYDSGEINRVFQLDGKTDGLWSEEEEIELAVSLNFDFDFSQFTAKINSISFYKEGDIRSICLYPREIIFVKTNNIEVPVRNGFSLYPTGELESIEPSEPFKIKTPVGEIFVYNPNAIGINADNNSLRFYKDGKISELITSENRVAVQTESGHLRIFAPYETENPLDGESLMTIGLHIKFDYESDIVTFTSKDPPISFSLSKTRFNIVPYLSCSSDCSSCSMKCSL
ncbi:MAG: hypothetical protein LBM93_02375 [Oscillospiraceae bacterium]|jgi:antitoxin component YwqK of YwqJK toxin-antitoxin module|nr:hypothetical protein [Oscillospiraceae bacterium]